MHLGNQEFSSSSLSTNLVVFSIEEIPPTIEVLQRIYEHIEERIQKVRSNMEAYIAAQATPNYQTILVSTMDLERKQLKLSIMHLIF